MTNWQTKTIGELVDYEQPSKYLVKDTNYIEDGTPVLTANKAFVLGYTHETEGIYVASRDSPVIIFDDFTTDNKFVDFDFKVKSSAIKILTAKSGKVLPRFVHGAMQLIKTEITEHKRRFISEYQFHPIDVPELSEQQRIVSVLGVWDEYIEKLEQKIALKEQLKKGLMQQLLTGRRRLPGFSDAWITVSLGEVGHARTSSVDKLSVAGEQSVRLLNYMDIYRRDHISNSDTFQMVTAKNAQIITSDLKKGDVLFTPSSETPTDIGHSAVVIEDLPLTVFSYHLMRLRMKDRYLSVNFAAYCFKTRAFYNELWKRAQGATRFTLSKEALESAKITIPADLEEQDQIAGILEVADREIETLRSTLREIKLQKKYLLKNLITGTIRTPETLKPKGVSL